MASSDPGRTGVFPPSARPVEHRWGPTSPPIDSVYFFMWPGWRTSARSNRWHYGLRWGRRAPVVFLQPELKPGAGWRSEAEGRLDNVDILSIQAADGLGRPSFDIGVVQASQIASYMRWRGHQRPLLWFYNPYLLMAYALVPASLRVFHATENYFDSDGSNATFTALKRAAIAISDKVICCSTGVLEGCRAATGRSDLAMIPNGCDYSFYTEPQPARGSWPDRLRPAVRSGQPIAVYAGNINLRMDFPLMSRLADELGGVHFVYAGAVDHDYLDASDRAIWANLIKRPNVSYLGVLDPDDLPALYAMADRGFIPYRPLPFLVKNGFPLKALEMAAAGLPVVSSLMEPLREVAEAVDLVSDDDGFVRQLGRASRRTRPLDLACRVDRLCREYDYDRHFDRMLEIVIPAVDAGPSRPAALSPIYDLLGHDRVLPDREPAAAPLPAAADTPRAVAPAVPPARRQMFAGSGLERLLLRLRGFVSHLLTPAPADLPFGQRVLWRIPPGAAALLPVGWKAGIKRVLRL